MTYELFRAQLNAEQQLALDERAAIIEYDGKFSRSKAEQLAMIDYLKQQRGNDEN